MMLTVRELSAGYGGQDAVREASFSLEAGQWLMICGPNGAGKSTLVKAATGTLPFQGTAELYGQDVRRMKPAVLARRVAVLSQRVSTEYDFTVEQVVALGRYAHRKGFLRSADPEGEAQIARALGAVGLADKRAARLSALSGGEVQRVFLAQVFAQDPELLVLDEPVNHLDVTYQKQIFDLIDRWRRTPGRAVMSVVHDLNLARRYGTHALLLDRGRVAAWGEAGAALTRERLAEVYGMDVLGWLREMLRCWETSDKK